LLPFREAVGLSHNSDITWVPCNAQPFHPTTFGVIVCARFQ
jgi:hypothetical protein